MKCSTICCIVIFSLIFLGVNIYGCLKLWQGWKMSAGQESLEVTIKKQQIENAKKIEKKIKEMEEGGYTLVENLPPSTHPTSSSTQAPTWPPTTWRATTRVRPTPDWKTHPWTRGRYTWHPRPVTTTVPPTTTATTTIPTTTEPETTTTTTRIIVTRPQPTTEQPTSHRIEVTRPHGHRHHGHHHHHHTTSTTEATITTTTESTTPSSTTTTTTTTSTTTTQKTQQYVFKTTPSVETTPNMTIVTALLDIGRGDWWEYRRPLDKYHEFMENLLSMSNYMVIFVDSNSYDFVHKYRKNQGLMHLTKIHLVTFDDLPLSRHLSYAQKIIEDELKGGDLYRMDQSMRGHPEAKSAEYDVLVCSKTYFLHNATIEDPFKTEWFSWIDAGYGHGNQSVYPYDNIWKPTFPKGKVSVIKLTPEHDLITSYNITKLYRKNWSVVSGGFIGGDKRSLGQLHTIVHNRFIQLIYDNKVDDDQTLMVLAIKSYPHLFNVQQGGWFDAFRLFSTVFDQERNFGR